MVVGVATLERRVMVVVEHVIAGATDHFQVASAALLSFAIVTCFHQYLDTVFTALPFSVALSNRKWTSHITSRCVTDYEM